MLKSILESFSEWMVDQNLQKAKLSPEDQARLSHKIRFMEHENKKGRSHKQIQAIAYHLLGLSKDQKDKKKTKKSLIDEFESMK